jgi:hypothetical protein
VFVVCDVLQIENIEKRGVFGVCNVHTIEHMGKETEKSEGNKRNDATYFSSSLMFCVWSVHRSFFLNERSPSSPDGVEYIVRGLVHPPSSCCDEWISVHPPSSGEREHKDVLLHPSSSLNEREALRGYVPPSFLSQMEREASEKGDPSSSSHGERTLCRS